MAGNAEPAAGFAADEQFLAVLAHELCNVAGPISNAMDLLQTKGIDEATARWTQGLMRRQVGQLIWMAESLRDASRLRRGLLQIHAEPVPLQDVVQAGVALAQTLIDGCDHALAVEYMDGGAIVVADRQRMAQSVAHLLHNAARFSTTAGRIWVCTARDEGDAIVRIRDEGIGIDRKRLPRIFDMFLPAGPSAEERPHGLGTGLALVAGLVRMQGGVVEASSRGTGQGSEFCIRLPALPLPRSRPVEGGSGISLPVRHRVLIVEDVVPAAKILATWVARWHHEVCVAYSGEQALDVAGSFHPDVVLLDLGLPGISGFDVAARLRSQAEFADARLVAVTGYGDDEHRRLTEAAGFSRYLTKPVAPDALQEVLA